MGASIYTSAMVLPYDAAAITTLDGLEFESNRIGQNIPSINVGENPIAIALNGDDNMAYVANYDSDTVSIIDGNTLNVSTVNVSSPSDIAVDDNSDIAYVVNSDSNTVSIINRSSGVYSNIGNITVGAGPSSIATTQRGVDKGIAYVVNSDSNTVSILHGPSQKVQTVVSFDVSPFYAGRIECNKITVPTNQYLYIDFQTYCKAQANPGFQFNSWIEKLGSNSSRTIRVSQGDWLMNALDWLMSVVGREPKDTPATLNVTTFGSFTANFERAPPAIPPEYLATLFTVVASAFIGSWLTPSFIGWRRAKKQGKKLDYYHEEVKHLSADGKLDKNDIDSLDKLRDKITDEYARGKMNKEQFDKLVDDISISYLEIFRKEIDSFTNLSEEDKEKEVNEIKDNIEDAYTKGKISEQYYNLLNKKIESFVNTTAPK
jgi:YVTN family beta-propeller protein